MRVLSFSIEAAKKSRKRRAARSPASAIIAGTTSELDSVDVVTAVTTSTTIGKSRRSALIAIPRNKSSSPPDRALYGEYAVAP
jgi:hypothetical protein